MKLRDTRTIHKLETVEVTAKLKENWFGKGRAEMKVYCPSCGTILEKTYKNDELWMVQCQKNAYHYTKILMSV